MEEVSHGGEDNEETGPSVVISGKVRKPVTLTLTPEHHKKVDDNKGRLGRTRADLIGLLIEKYADTVTETVTRADNYQRLCDAVGVLGGTLKYEAWNGPRGGTWRLTLGPKRLEKNRSDIGDLDACYRVKDGIRTNEIDPTGLAKLFARLASNPDLETE